MPLASRSEIQRGRELRAQMTDAEVRLWMRLREKQIGGHRFRRQVPVGQYIVDFLCKKAHLIIEVDGGQHLLDVARDEHRTAWLQSRGFRVLRFWDNDVLQQTDSVLESIRVALLEVPAQPPQI
jgi:very-short-patch-repair endonuclease